MLRWGPLREFCFMHEPNNATKFGGSGTNPEISCSGRDQGLTEGGQLSQRTAELETELEGTPASRSKNTAARERFEDFDAAMEAWYWETGAQLRFTYFSRSILPLPGSRRNGTMVRLEKTSACRTQRRRTFGRRTLSARSDVSRSPVPSLSGAPPLALNGCVPTAYRS